MSDAADAFTLTRPQPLEASPQRLGERLVDEGLISSLQLRYALEKQAVEKEKIGSLLLKHGLVSEGDIGRFLAMQRGIPFVDVNKEGPPSREVFAAFNRELCLTYGFLPLERRNDALRVVLGDGDAGTVTDLVIRRCGLKADFVQGEFSRVSRAIRHYFHFAQHPVETLLEREIRRLADDPDKSHSPETFLDHLLHLAIRERATDIHIAPGADSLHVLLRVDGVLRPLMALPKALARAMTFVKLAAEMDVAEQRLPLDGSFQARILDAGHTIRVSTLVTEYGERMVLRLLPERGDTGGLLDLGFLERDVRLLERLFARPAGLILMTGPTGSGKSTTLHSALRMQSLIERNVVTIEDPIEYRVPGACQTEVNRRAGYEFGSAMRHFLRHDPDVILVGEIRDRETALAALDAASTGHLVLSTLHVGSVFGVVPRLRLLGADAESIAENLVAVVNQRLVRTNCPGCSTEQPITEEERRFLGAQAPARLRHGAGCERCGGTGYYGRLPVYELLAPNRTVSEAIAADASRQTVRRLTEEAGFAGIEDMARSRVLQGQTSMAEILRAVGEGA